MISMLVSHVLGSISPERLGWTKIGDAFITNKEWSKTSLPIRNLSEMVVKYNTAREVVFNGDSLYQGNKPFEIISVSVTKGGVVVAVRGKETTNIIRKWTNRISKKVGQLVTLRWED